MNIVVHGNDDESEPEYISLRFTGLSLTIERNPFEITSIDPNPARVGEELRIKGTDFTSNTLDLKVAFGNNDFDNEPESANENRITIVVPGDAEAKGKIKVQYLGTYSRVPI